MAGERRTVEIADEQTIQIEQLDDGLLDTRCICGARPEICGHTPAERAALMEAAEVESASKAPGWGAAITRTWRRIAEGE